MDSPVTQRLLDAVAFAARVHASQPKKGTTTPYFAHLLGVASLALENGADEEEAIAALLHDTIEDGGDPTAVRREIAARFGDRVLAIVEGCTDTDVKPKPPWRPRKEAYLAHLAHASRSVLLVATADKLHSARSILADFRQLGDEVWGRFKAGREGTLWYYRTMLAVLRSRRDAPVSLVRELQETVVVLEREVGSRGDRPVGGGGAGQPVSD